eukprot:TRINITY_DN13578_c0_g1_i1.p1 TRINITY_DN13578_c0_g1~~TRINITY_DN13578_c0_g1_i1.p1  ORF type:complete len:661 (-),score=218.68 TRINITY_DN13578_c0_g1_i1:4-1737(-)
MGDDPIQFQVLSDQKENFPTTGKVNYENENINIGMPIFAIHGNHDEPKGEGGFGALDLLAVSNYINYFGKHKTVDEITIYPVLLEKGNTRIALYGIGALRDERLHRLFQQKKVKFMRPPESDKKDNDEKDWFNILILHQNRAEHSAKNHIKEAMIEDFIDLVIWGHEHECMIESQSSSVSQFYITQPGSSIATSLSEGETKKKHVGVLSIRKTGDFKIDPIPLKTVRPFILESVILSQESELDPTDMKGTESWLMGKVEEMIEKVTEECENDMKPLVRLKVDYTNFEKISVQRFGQAFVGKVANPGDILLLSKKRLVKVKGEGKEEILENMVSDKVDNRDIEDLIPGFISAPQKILPEHELNRALNDFVSKQDNQALKNYLDAELKEAQEDLDKKIDIKENDIGQCIVNMCSKRIDDKVDIVKKGEDDDNFIIPLPSESDMKKDIDDDEEEEVVKPKKKAPPTKKTPTKKAVKKTTTKKTTPKKVKIEVDEDVEEDSPPPKPKRTRATTKKVIKEEEDISEESADSRPSKKTKTKINLVDDDHHSLSSFKPSSPDMKDDEIDELSKPVTEKFGRKKK